MRGGSITRNAVSAIAIALAAFGTSSALAQTAPDAPAAVPEEAPSPR